MSDVLTNKATDDRRYLLSHLFVRTYTYTDHSYRFTWFCTACDATPLGRFTRIGDAEQAGQKHAERFHGWTPPKSADKQ